jgi:sterol desaturase/sphingolipid hydroxylase (fatty acid hydroxylase superfamily)
MQIACEVTKSIVMLQFIEWVTRDKEPITPTLRRTIPAATGSDLIITSSIKGVTHVLIRSTAASSSVRFPGPAAFSTNPLRFVALSFAAEVLFDFAHYWMHRAAHWNRTLYRWVHKKHHRDPHPSAMSTFCMTPQDVLLTYSVPLVFCLAIVPMEGWDFELFISYLLFQEICGHIGKRMAPTSSFVQCVWIPKALGRIELYTEDHDRHHTQPRCNFSKRFSLWDKLFGTYRGTSRPL